MTVLLTAQLLAHLGALHDYEKALVFVIAFGPFVVLGVVVMVMRRRDIAAEQRDGQESASQDAPT